MQYTTTLSHSCVLRKLSVNTAAFTEREFCIEHETYLQLKSNSLQQLSHPRFRHILGKGEGGVTLIIITLNTVKAITASRLFSTQRLL